MQKIFLLFFSLLICAFMQAQQIPFQGKLLENGTPVNGSRTFDLSINQGSINWSETQSNVAVVNGLYNLILGAIMPLPKGLFNDSNSVTLSVSVNGQALSDVVIYMPFGMRWKAGGESNIYFEEGNVGVGTDDPQEKLHIKGEGSVMKVEGSTHAFMEFYPDGYSAGRKGFLGYDSDEDDIFVIKNEVDKLQLRSNSIGLTLSNNGTVGIGFSNPNYKLDVNGGIKIGGTNIARAGGIRYNNGDFEGYNGTEWLSFLDSSVQQETFTVGSIQTSTTTALEQLSFNNSTITNSIWQSFSVLAAAPLESIEVTLANTTTVDIRLRIYEGEGTSAQAIFDQVYDASDFSATLELQSFPIATNVQTPFILDAGTTYTFQIEGIGDDLSFRFADNNPYTFGRMNTDTQNDAVFKINVSTTDGYNLDVKSDSTIVGNDLFVQGRVKDQFGYVVPVGGIMPFGGANPPEGWLLCDGREVRRDFYADLFAMIGTNWGAGDGSTTFRLPDLRGQFLRGVSGSSNEDPNRNSRTAKYSGGSTDNNVGSYQQDELKRHGHPVYYSRQDGGSKEDEGYLTLDTTAPVEIHSANTGSPQRVTSNLNTNAVGGAGGSESRPKNAYVNYIIKY
ncbi:MAG: tail fiber protein [Bacteroidota bacterium]